MMQGSFVANHLCRRSVVSYLLYPFSLLFSLILMVRRELYKSILKTYKAPVFIISIGNVTAGGSGKTPFTIYLAGLLHNMGLKIAVSHRGYKSELENVVTLISDRTGLLNPADKAGDEAWLLAKRLPGIPVATGKDRTAAIKLMCNKFPDLDCIILDDSFQHLKVKHDLDIIIANNELGFGNGFVIPAGYLREPLSAIKRADLLIINARSESAPLHKAVAGVISQTGKPYFKGYYQPARVYNFNGTTAATDWSADAKVMLLAGIGNPDSFNATAMKLKVEIVERVYLPDHCDYSSNELRQRIMTAYRASGATHILTTEKDYAKLRMYQEFSACLLVLAIGFSFGESETKLADFVAGRISDQRKISR
jgi:tetraacyldisaccharide 4'-kinase